MQHFAIPPAKPAEEVFEEGVGFDGSSVRGWQAIHESDMLVIPDPATACIDPFCKATTRVLQCDIADPITRERYSRCPRYMAQKAENYLTLTGIADTVYFGSEADCDFPLKGDAFTEDVIRTWIEYKRNNEVDALRLRPHPHEFYLYYDV